MRRAAAAIAQCGLVLLALATPFLLLPGMWSLPGLALIGVSCAAGPKARGAARKTQGARQRKQDEPSVGES